MEISTPKQVKVLLRDLDIHPDTVLVIRGDELLTREEIIADGDSIEIRPVISGGEHKVTKCRRCREHKAVVELPRHNSAFCRGCFELFFVRQVEKAISDDGMIKPGERVLVAVSGGKDSLALWDVLIRLGYETTGFHIVLWTGEDYASESAQICRDFATQRGVELVEVDLKDEYGFAVPDLPSTTGRPTCGACGLSKRHIISKAARDLGFDVIAIGHNLDDEAAVLLGNTLRWDTGYLARQSAVLQEGNGFTRKVKPLIRLSEKETATYAFLNGLDYVVEECPLVAGNTQMRYKQALDLLESGSPGTKAAFIHGFLDKAKSHFEESDPVELVPCESCGMPTPAGVCAFCRMVELHTLRKAAR